MDPKTQNSSVCEFNRSVATHLFYILPEAAGTISGISAVCILVYSFLLYGFRLLFHHNAKILMILLTIFCLLFSLDIAFVSSMQIYKALTYVNDCDVVMFGSFCSIFRRIALTCFVGVSATQFAQTIERTIATMMKEKYEFQAHWLGGILVLFSFLLSLLTIEWTLWNEDPNEAMTHCLTYSASVSVGERMFVVLHGILVLDILILVLFCVLYYNNNKKTLTAGLSHKYQQHENLTVIRALFPMILLNSIFVSLYILSATIVRGFKDHMSLQDYKLFAINTFIFPHVSFLLSITIYWTTKNEQRRRMLRIHALERGDKINNGKTYFSMYESQWNSPRKTEQ